MKYRRYDNLPEHVREELALVDYYEQAGYPEEAGPDVSYSALSRPLTLDEWETVTVDDEGLLPAPTHVSATTH
ncbi:hypothetical protein RWE87_04860 [Sinorhizobium meliloti]|uniref:hypothetical protein n=1 Tax=Rhizobium meliloti TaxID=382 RepID=UPI00299E1DC0|nr:hypothetical protein [Sinorhizobium meliloti]